MSRTAETPTSVAHSGGINGFNTLVVRLVDQHHLIVLLDNTSQGRYLDPLAASITNILYGRPFDMPKRSIAEALQSEIASRGAAAGVVRYRELKASPEAAGYDFGEQELNQIGYELLQQGKVDDAIEIFKLNVEAYPQSANTHDSLGEAYARKGEKELAIASYRKSLELDPKNANAAARLKALVAPAPAEAKVDSALYDAYAGEYQLGPGFVLAVTREGDRLMTQATGQQKIEIFPETETHFFLKVVDAQIDFVRDETGKVTHLVLHQGGRDIHAPKVE